MTTQHTVFSIFSPSGPAAAKVFASLFLAGAGIWAPLLAQAACPDANAVAAYIDDYKIRRAHDAFKGMSLEDAQCARRQLIAELPRHVGPVIGYRLLFTRDEVRAMRQFDAPVWGAMFGNAFYASPGKVPVNFGARIVWEPDLLVEVKGPGLAEAKTPMQALRSIAAVIPYIDLKDNMLDAFAYADYVAVNASFRTGVTGQRIAVKPTNKYLRNV